MSDGDSRTSLLDRLTGGATAAGDDPRVAQFVRGVALGALVGAAIAGSSLWGRRRGRQASRLQRIAGSDSAGLPSRTPKDVTPSS